MPRRRLFTRNDVWLGSFYELAIELGPRSDERLAAASKALWRHPALDGPYGDRGREPWEQEVVSPSLVVSDGVVHLYGAATIPSGHQVASGSFAVREHESGIDWLDFYIPLAALGTIYEIEYPHNERWRTWAESLDQWFREIARSIYEKVSFALALIGEEVSGCTDAREVAAAGVPKRRTAPMLLPNEHGELASYPATE